MLLTHIQSCGCLTFPCPRFPLRRTFVRGFCISTREGGSAFERRPFVLQTRTEGKTDLQNIFSIVSFGGRRGRRFYQNGKRPLCTVTLLFAERRHVLLSFSTPRTPPPAIVIWRRAALSAGDEQVSLTCSFTVFLPFAVARGICLFLHLTERSSRQNAALRQQQREKGPRRWMTCTTRTFSC